MIGSYPITKGVKKSKSSVRSEYLKINFTPSEMEVFNHKFKRVSKLYKEKGLVLNLPDFFRILAFNFDDSDLFEAFFPIYSADVSPFFEMGSKWNIATLY